MKIEEKKIIINNIDKTAVELAVKKTKGVNCGNCSWRNKLMQCLLYIEIRGWVLDSVILSQ